MAAWTSRPCRELERAGDVHARQASDRAEEVGPVVLDDLDGHPDGAAAGGDAAEAGAGADRLAGEQLGVVDARVVGVALVGDESRTRPRAAGG